MRASFVCIAELAHLFMAAWLVLVEFRPAPALSPNYAGEKGAVASPQFPTLVLCTTRCLCLLSYLSAKAEIGLHSVVAGFSGGGPGC